MGRIANLLEPDLLFETNRGVPLSPVMQTCIALNSYAGGQFQRISGLCGDVSQHAVRMALNRVTNALVKKRNQFIFMPSSTEMEETSGRMFNRFYLPRFAMAVDGMHVRFQEAPRRLPPQKHKQQFWCRKQFYSINVQVVAGDRFIYDLDCRWPGSTHDSRIWNRSQVKAYLEQQRRFLLAGDSGYPISEILIKPYTTVESGQDRTKRLFNRRLSGLRTVMSENIYGVWKRRFPILKSMRTDFLLSQRIIVATAVLFNIGRLWGDEEDDDEERDDDDEPDGEMDQVVVLEGDPGTVRVRGQVERDRLKDAMQN